MKLTATYPPLDANLFIYRARYCRTNKNSDERVLISYKAVHDRRGMQNIELGLLIHPNSISAIHKKVQNNKQGRRKLQNDRRGRS